MRCYWSDCHESLNGHHKKSDAWWKKGCTEIGVEVKKGGGGAETNYIESRSMAL
jgi:hypothetical protein